MIGPINISLKFESIRFNTNTGTFEMNFPILSEIAKYISNNIVHNVCTHINSTAIRYVDVDVMLLCTRTTCDIDLRNLTAMSSGDIMFTRLNASI